MLGEFLLPFLNMLPHTSQDLYAIMKEIGMEYQQIDVCINDNNIYIMDNIHRKQNACNVRVVDIE